MPLCSKGGETELLSHSYSLEQHQALRTPNPTPMQPSRSSQLLGHCSAPSVRHIPCNHGRCGSSRAGAALWDLQKWAARRKVAFLKVIHCRIFRSTLDTTYFFLLRVQHSSLREEQRPKPKSCTSLLDHTANDRELPFAPLRL